LLIDAEAVLNFWFNNTSPSQWFNKDPEFDALVRERFLILTRQALAGDPICGNVTRAVRQFCENPTQLPIAVGTEDGRITRRVK
jgi:uncharacterized protein (DUF924 family)